MQLKIIDDISQIVKILELESPILINVSLNSCEACAHLDETLELIEQPHLRAYKVKIKEEDYLIWEDILIKYQVDNFPTCLLFHKGQLVDGWYGFDNSLSPEKRATIFQDALSTALSPLPLPQRTFGS